MASGVLTGTAMIKEKFIQKRVAELTDGYMVTDAIFKSNPTDALSIVYESNENGLIDNENSADVEERAELGSYPRIGMSTDEKQAMIKDYGLDVLLSYNAVTKNQISSIDRAYIRLGNSLVKFVDSLGLKTLTDNYNASSQRINTATAGVAWDQAGADPFADLLTAKEKVDSMGYMADVALVSPTDWSKALKNKDFRAEIDKDVPAADKIVRAGLLKGKVAGLIIVEARNLTAGNVVVVQKEIVGDRHQNTNGVETETYRDGNSKKAPYIVSAFREFVDTMADPKAATLLTGV